MALINKLSAIGEAIREKTGKEDLLTLDEMPAEIRDIETGGDSSFYDDFWDSYLQNGERTDYTNAFAGTYWTTNIFDTPKYVLKPTIADRMFQSTGITEIPDGVLDTSQCTNMNYMFQTTKMLKIPIIDCSNCTALTNTFREGYMQESITDIILVNVRADCTFSNTFYYTSNLVNLNITGTIGQNISFAQSSTLSSNSVQKIIDCLDDLTGTTAQTITFHTAVKGNLSDAQIATITNKNWTLA